MRRTYKEYRVLDDKTLALIIQSLIQEHKTPNHVSREWLIERLSQCASWIEGFSGMLDGTLFREEGK